MNAKNRSLKLETGQREKGEIETLRAELETLQQRDRRRQALHELRREVWMMEGPGDIDQVIGAVLRCLRAMEIQFAHCSVNVMGLDPGHSLALFHHMNSEGSVRRVQKSQTAPFLHRAWRKGHIVYRPDLQWEDPFGERDWLQSEYGPIRTVLDVPFSYGTLGLNSESPDAFSDTDIALLGELAEVLSEGYRRLDDLERLSRTEEQLRSVLETAPDLVFTIKLDGKILYANRSLQEGGAADEMIGQNGFEFVHPEDRERARSAIEQVQRSGQSAKYEVRSVDMGQGSRWYACHSGPLLRNGEVAAVTAVCSDITERRDLLQEHARMAAIVEAADAAIMSSDLEGRITSWNQGAQTLFGYSAEEMLGESLRRLAPPERQGEVREKMAQLKRGGHLRGFETERLRKDGSRVPVSLIVSPIYGEDRQVSGFATIIYDLTERKRIEVEVRRARDRAEAANRAKSAFLANMSHELRTPLNSIIGFTEILGDQTFGPLNDKQKTYVGHVLQGGRHLLGLINNILDLSKVEIGRMELVVEGVDVAKTFEACCATLRSVADKKGVYLDYRIGEGVSELQADPAKLKQILYNLLSNAVKFTPQGGEVVLHVEARNQEQVLFSVADSGPGIGSMDLERIFEPFEQGDAARASDEPGTGLGLALARRLVELHGGRIWAESAGRGQGSTFRFALPLARAEDRAEHHGGGETCALPEGASHQPAVLVVEDDPQARDLIELYLREAGYRVAWCRNGEEVLDAARRVQPDAITLDIVLPGRDGWQVLDELKRDQATRDIPVIIVSVNEDRELGMALGAVECFAKPVDRERLVVAVDRALALRDVRHVLVVDDEEPMVQMLTDMLEVRGYEVLQARSGREAIELALEEQPDLMVLDLVMPGVSGFDVIEQLRDRPEAQDLQILVYTGRDLKARERRQLNERARNILSKGDEGKRELMQCLRMASRSARDRTE